jgi:hypothetical protein
MLRVIFVRVNVSQRETKIWGKAFKVKSLTMTIGLAMADLYTVGPWMSQPTVTLLHQDDGPDSKNTKVLTIALIP